MSYKVGEIKIRELRKKAEERIGDAFRLDEFHDCILCNGALPLTSLEGIVDKWLEKA